MTRQEEIREGMEAMVSDMVYGIRYLGAHFTSQEIATRLLEFEHSQGVVIKIEGGVIEGCSIIPQTNAICPYKEAGYVAVEPLIER